MRKTLRPATEYEAEAGYQPDLMVCNAPMKYYEIDKVFIRVPSSPLEHDFLSCCIDIYAYVIFIYLYMRIVP